MADRTDKAERSDKVAGGGSAVEPTIHQALCRDEDGNRYNVIGYRPYPFIGITDYALEDGAAVRCIDENHFEIESTGRRITRSDE